MRGRGLKHLAAEVHTHVFVAPHAGAWIETIAYCSMSVCTHVSPPMRGRGLKQPVMLAVFELQRVAPHAGAWIETAAPSLSSPCRPVAPHAGAWIETQLNANKGKYFASPPMRGRGLKPADPGQPLSLYRRPPCGGVD